MTLISKYERIFVALDNGPKITKYYNYLLRQEQNVHFGIQQSPKTIPKNSAQESLPISAPEANSKDSYSVESLIATRLDPDLTKPRFVGPDAVDLTSDYKFDLDLLSVPMKVQDFYTEINVCFNNFMSNN